MGRDKVKAQKVDHGGNYRQLPAALLDSASWNGLTMRARCLCLALVQRFNGFNNGRIAASARDLAEAIGSHRYAANRAAIGELVAAGIVAIERVHPRGSRMATEYRLTFIQSGLDGHRSPATNEWRSIKSGNKWKNSGAETSTRNGERVDAVSGDRKRRVDGASTDATETSHFPGHAPAADASTLIVSHSQPLRFQVSEGVEYLENADGRFYPSCLLTVDQLRALTRDYLTWAGVGSQTRLALDAGVPGGSLSKFLSGKSIATQHRVKLQLAVGRAWPLNERPVVGEAA